MGNNSKPGNLEERFFSKFKKGSKESCWIWQGSVFACGYGRISIRENDPYKEGRAHRLAYILHHGITEIPQGWFVCHTCDVPLCVNPKHLFLGTPKQNSEDMVAKGRVARPDPKMCSERYRGEKNGSAKLTDALAMQIYKASHSGILTQKEIAEIYEVTQTIIGAIKRKAAWKHIHV